MNELIASLLASGVIDAEAAEILAQQLDGEYARTSAETSLYSSVLGALQQQQDAVVAGIDTVFTAPDAAELLATVDDTLGEFMLPAIEEIATDRAVAVTVNVSTALSDDALEAAFMRVNEAVLSWANDYYLSLEDDDHGSLPNLNATSRQQFLDVFELWNRGSLPNQASNRGLPNLIEALEPVFGPTRAERIASTEVTRIFGEATKQAGRNSDVITGLRWSTSNDERVCPTCGPLHNAIAPIESDSWTHPALGQVRHPAHPRCRCDLIPTTELVQ